MKRLFLILSRKQLFTICKTFVKISFALDIIHDETFNNFLKENLEKAQYSAALIINLLLLEQ